MTDQPIETARCVVIGGGIVGAATLYHLARAGWTDSLLLEKNELTAGSTWHAAGNCPNFSTDWAVLRLQREGLALYRALAADPETPIDYHVCGAIRLAHGVERMREFAQVRAMAAQQGLEMEMASPADLKERYPFLETHDLAGGLWDPLDGFIDPAQATQALASAARRLGARIDRFRPALGATRVGDAWRIETPTGPVLCEAVVNAAGYYAQQVARWFLPYGGRTPPMVVLQHQYLLTDEIPEIGAWSAEQGRKLPLLRDPDVSYYLRQEKSGLNLGPYERACQGRWTGAPEEIPEDFSFQLFPDDLDRLEPYIEDAMARVPLLGEAGVSKVINGPIPYAPDGLPLIGPSPGVPNVFEACAFTFGVAQGGGAGKLVADWVTTGAPDGDYWSVDPRRFTAHADHAYAVAAGLQTYGHEYAMHFPHRDWPAGRPRKRSAAHALLADRGAQFVAVNGWERARWFAAPGAPVAAEDTLTWARSGPWRTHLRAECQAVRDAAGVLDLPGFSRFALTGAGAAAWLETQIAGRAPRVGRVGLGYFLDDRGRIVTEMSILRTDDDAFELITAAAAQWHDADWLRARLPASGGLTLVDETEARSALLLTGPEARAALARIGTDADLQRPWLSHQTARVAGRAARLARVSFAGELGWEIHAAPEDAGALWPLLVEAGATPFGMAALDSLRLEKAYRAWKQDLSTDHTLLEAGLERFAAWDKPAFRGREALLAERARGPRKRFAAMIVDAGDCDAPAMAPIRRDGALVGATSSGGWGWRIDASIALGFLSPEAAAPGTRLEIEIFGEPRPAVVQPPGPLWDPTNERIRA